MKNVPFFTAILFAIASTVAVAADGPIDVVKQVAADFNKGASFSSLCMESTAIVDDFPPHAWQGVGACDKWSADLKAFMQRNGDTNPKVSLGTPKHNDVTGDVAYVVVPAKFSYIEKGKTMSDDGLFTFAMKKTATGWRITGWAWSQQ